MPWYEALWPFGRKNRERRRQIEADFEDQLKEAYKRHGDLDDIVRQLREDRETPSRPKPALQGSDT